MATDDATKRLDRASKLLDKLRELQAQTYEVTEELRKILGGQDALGDVLKRLEASFSAEWSRRYQTPYAWTYIKDRPHWKRLLKITSEADILARVCAYFHDEDPYISRAKHPFGLFVSRFNTLVPAAPLTLDAPVVADCRHVPPCASDQLHTQRRTADMRAGVHA